MEPTCLCRRELILMFDVDLDALFDLQLIQSKSIFLSRNVIFKIPSKIRMEADNSEAWVPRILKAQNRVESNKKDAQARHSFSHTFEEHGTGTILLYQNYCPLFYQQKKLEQELQAITLKLYPEDGEDHLVKVVITNDHVTLERKYPDNDPSPHDIKEPVRLDYKPIFPTMMEAPELLYKKLWIQLNRMSNRMVVSVGDMYNSNSQSLMTFNFDNDYHNNKKNSWNSQEQSFPMPCYVQGAKNDCQHPVPSQEKKINILSLAKRMTIDVDTVDLRWNKMKGGKAESSTQQLTEFLTVKFMKNIRSYSPVLEPNPSVLDETTAPLADMPK